MRKSLIYFLLLAITAYADNSTQNDDCKVRYLSKPVPPTRLNYNISNLIKKIGHQISQKQYNFSQISRQILSEYSDILGVILTSKDESILALSVNSRLKIFPNQTSKTETFWKSFTTIKNGWGAPFKDCNFLRNVWFYCYVHKSYNYYNIGLFKEIVLDQCDRSLADIFNGSHRCDDTQLCVSDVTNSENSGRYRCICRQGFFYQGANLSWKGLSGEDIEKGRIDSIQCKPCPPECSNCEPNGICAVRQDVYLKTIILCIQLASMGITFILALIVFKQRKTKAIATGMWTILETILLGTFILYNTVVVKIFKPSTVQCLMEPWMREVGFIICYGAIILKLYRHLIEFRTRKAHRWVVKDTDLLKYLLIMIMSVTAYMAAYTAITLNFMQENYSLLYLGLTHDGEQFQGCKYLWWDYVTETGELVILIFGIHLAYASRNARTQFHERSFLCAAISIELAVSSLFYVARALLLHQIHPDMVLIIYCIRTQLSQTLSLILIFSPKFWYQQKQVRSLGQEYSCRLPLDAFKDVNAHGPLTSNNSDVDIGEITIADMSPDDIRAELKRLYLQLEMFKAKTICRDNPHISKRRGGRKPQHRRFSLQKKGSKEKSMHAKHKDKEKKKELAEVEVTEVEISRTPEDSICSNEGPSGVYADLPSANITTNTQ